MEQRNTTIVDGSSMSTSCLNSHRVKSRERKLFMSSKVSHTLMDIHPLKFSSNDSDNDKQHQKQEFQSIYKEVRRLGLSQMSWKERKAIEAKQMLSLGAKPEKRYRVPISVGKIMTRKREKLEEQKQQEEIALGLRPAKREKKTHDKPKAENRGLKASEGIFKGGVLYVKPLVVKEAENKLHGSNFPLGKGKRKSHTKRQKGKGKGKKKR